MKKVSLNEFKQVTPDLSNRFKKGCKSNMKGKTFEELYGKKRAEEMKKLITNRNFERNQQRDKLTGKFVKLNKN